jgi:hypothetical protein
MAQYSGDDPHQASTVWLDRAFGMGGMVREVILGYDCPADAILLNATVHDQGSSTRRNAICVFERESGRPLSRHTGQGRNEMGAVKGYELVVRSVSTVGNYDYLVSRRKEVRADDISLTTRSSWTGRSRFGCLRLGICREDCGTRSSRTMVIRYMGGPWGHCTITSSTVRLLTQKPADCGQTRSTSTLRA